jgi:hypothetical protein
MKNCRWCCLCCGLLVRGGRGQAACVTGGHWDGWQWQSQWQMFEQKRGWIREKERGSWKMGLLFHAVLYCYCFLAYLFKCRSIDFLSRSSQLLDGLLLQNFSSSCPNFGVDWLFIKFKSTVYCSSLARFLFQSFKFGHHISVWQL